MANNKIIILSPFCKSKVILTNDGLSKYFSNILRILNKNFQKEFNSLILSNDNCICKNNKCIPLPSIIYRKYGESRNLFIKSIYSIFLSFYVLKINRFIKKINPEVVINNYFFQIKHKKTIWVQHSSVEAYKGKLNNYKILNFITYIIKLISGTAKPWKVANYIVNYTKYDEINFPENKKYFCRRFFIPLSINKNNIISTLPNSNNLKNFVFISRLSPEKNINFLVKVANYLNNFYSLSIDVYGYGKNENLVINTPGINYLGPVYNKNVISILRQYKIFILTSDYEGFSYSVVEAMSQGMYVIARNTYNNLKYLLDNNRGSMINKNADPSEFANVMYNKLLANVDKHRLDCIEFVKNNLINEEFDNNWIRVINYALNEQ